MTHFKWTIAVCLMASTAAAQDLNTMTAEDLLPMAQAEGSVIVYSFTSRIARVEEAFEAAYPGIDLQGFDISSTEQIARLKAEAAAGTVNADVVYISDAAVVIPELLAAGIIETYVPPRRRPCWHSAFLPRC
jgi:iron(III) transport system substrate-binding protein